MGFFRTPEVFDALKTNNMKHQQLGFVTLTDPNKKIIPPNSPPTTKVSWYLKKILEIFQKMICLNFFWEVPPWGVWSDSRWKLTVLLRCIAPICHPQGGCGEAAYNLGDYFTEIKDTNRGPNGASRLVVMGGMKVIGWKGLPNWNLWKLRDFAKVWKWWVCMCGAVCLYPWVKKRKIPTKIR